MQRKRTGQRSAVLGPELLAVGDFGRSVNLARPQLPHLPSGGRDGFHSPRDFSVPRLVILLLSCR